MVLFQSSEKTRGARQKYSFIQVSISTFVYAPTASSSHSCFLQRVQRESRDDEELVRARDLSAPQAFFGGITGLSISFLLFGFAKTIQANFDGRAVPDSYQARQITITVRTIVEGLAYLATFIYAANGIGLISLGLQKCLGNKVSTGEDTDSRLPESENVVEEK